MNLHQKKKKKNAKQNMFSIQFCIKKFLSSIFVENSNLNVKLL